MFGSDILDVVIGMVFVFLLLSLLCTAINEFLESILKNRAADLERGIAELLGDPENESKFIDEIYNHGLVNSLFKGSYSTASKSDLPSYIPAANFASAVLDVVTTLPKGVTIPKNLQAALANFKASAGADAAKVRASIEGWYNTSMDRVTGWYKRRTQWITLALGLIVAVAVNADTVNMARRLSDDASLRKGLVAAAQARAANPLPANDSAKAQDQISADIKSLGGLGLPIGWAKEFESPRYQDLGWWTDGLLENLKSRALGWLLTAIAISMGAPFWFDLLGKFINVRSTIKPDGSKS